MTDLVLDSRDGIATLTINRPHKRNAMTLQMWRDLAAVVADVAADHSVRVLVVTGGQHFSAGADIGEFPAVRMDAEAGRAYDAVVECAEQALIGIAKPTIAVISGYCIGGGCEIALACDIRLASDDAVFALTPTRVGLVYSLTGMQRLVDTVGPAWAKQILYSAEQLPVTTAARIGLVNEVHACDHLEERAMELARTISCGARTSVAGSKVLIERILRQRNVAEDQAIADVYNGAYASADYREGVSAFLEKRAPNFLATAVELPG